MIIAAARTNDTDVIIDVGKHEKLNLSYQDANGYTALDVSKILGHQESVYLFEILKNLRYTE